MHCGAVQLSPLGGRLRCVIFPTFSGETTMNDRLAARSTVVRCIHRLLVVVFVV
ncbi:expressed unknown protein [Ectocarpus siliculosus]|uniref:Uncharacterized protein n=1 Tax=Ectocarpus siliculosus TaxID=2880 RepID=D7FU44_ECTSI|nr:expressed unknown protein [Ectocarpus siliculosus]|eukprot:CBJ31571.1 expressed unknown protein [Ectocarpus siliculosus]